MQPKYILLPQIDGEKITFASIYKNQFNSWNLKDQIILNPYEIDHIPLANITKFKIYNQQPIEGHYLIKIQSSKTTTDKNNESNEKEEAEAHLFAVSAESHKVFYEKLLIYKFLSMDLQFDPSQTFQTQIEDDMMKKSQFLGNWEERHVKITTGEGLTSKKIQKQKQSLHVKQTKQIWTRFEVLNNNQHIVMKIKYLLGKSEFAIPVKNCGKWIRALYSLFTTA